MAETGDTAPGRFARNTQLWWRARVLVNKVGRPRSLFIDVNENSWTEASVSRDRSALRISVLRKDWNAAGPKTGYLILDSF